MAKPPKTPRPQKPPILPPDENAELIPTISLTQEKLVGRVVVLWARVEAAMEDMIWHFYGVHMEKGRIITTRMDTVSKITMLRQLRDLEVKEPLYSELSLLLDRVDILREDRNSIVHGIWGRTMGGTPLVVSLRPKPLAPNQVVSETFPDIRMRTIVADIEMARVSLIEMMEKLFSIPHKPAAPNSGS
jgi:hypothetical protein